MVYDLGTMKIGGNNIRRDGPPAEIGKEIGIHGGRWEKFHHGYFSDPAVSGPLIEVVVGAVEKIRPTAVIDLGGGTGYLLSELLKRKIDPSIRLFDLDCSPRQLKETRSERITGLCLSLEDFKREMIASDADRVLFLMRSVLHYFGKDGLKKILSYLRAQMKKGEYFIHQTACFDSTKGADCLNRIYAAMGTIKWYPTAAELIPRLEAAGWDVLGVAEAPPLRLTSNELGERYRLRKKRNQKIREEILETFGEIAGILERTAGGFIAYLPYKIFRCRRR